MTTGQTETARPVADRFLAHLQLTRDAPTRDYLDHIIREHQLRVPFETLTKLTDYDPGLRRGDFMPSMTEYVERIVTRGAGGLCWTLARGLHFLLADVGFRVSFMYMAPGHCCVRVELPEGPFYAEVGYAAPIFRAYPLFESFSLDTHRERFDYRVGDGAIQVTRNPGPTKTLDPRPRQFDELREWVAAANDWTAPQSFLHHLSYARHVDGVYTALRDDVLTRYLPGGPEKTIVAREDRAAIVADLFGADPDLYKEAADVHARHEPA